MPEKSIDPDPQKKSHPTLGFFTDANTLNFGVLNAIKYNL